MVLDDHHIKVRDIEEKSDGDCFWDSQGVILIDYLEKGKNTTVAYYASLLDKLKAELAEKWPHLQKKILFHQDNALSHTSVVAIGKIHELLLELLDHPPYSLDLAPSDFLLFPHLNIELRGQRFCQMKRQSPPLTIILQRKTPSTVWTGYRDRSIAGRKEPKPNWKETNTSKVSKSHLHKEPHTRAQEDTAYFHLEGRGSRNNPALVHESVRFGGGVVLVYGGISIDGRTELYIIRDGPLTVRRYREEIFRPIVVTYAAAIGDDFILMDDNCRPHHANLVEDFLFEEGIV
ncbi:transposable element Tcb2 transposase [Trichonephila clavipes]|nr:transposable element Tcb2 transposase [Trichonephila clavipes]